jgi:hypothetical protein
MATPVIGTARAGHHSEPPLQSAIAIVILSSVRHLTASTGLLAVRRIMALEQVERPGPAECFSSPCLRGGSATQGEYEWGGLATSKVGFLTCSPSNRAFLQRCNKLGVPCYVYVTFSMGFNTTLASNSTPYPLVTAPGEPTPLYQGIDFSTAKLWMVNSKGGRVSFRFGERGFKLGDSGAHRYAVAILST